MFKRTAFTVTILSALPAAVALSACSSHQQSAPGSSSSTSAPGGQTLSAEMRSVDGRSVATATFDFANGYATITVKTVANGILTPGFHGLHIHEVGKCEPHSADPMGGPPGDFLSAGMHYQAPGHDGKPASGDLPELQVRKDGGALLVTTTDAFTRDDLLSGNKTSILLHGGADTQDVETRVACGVIGTG